ncbi:hypothetical protein [Xanthobacter sp. KR7-225]
MTLHPIHHANRRLAEARHGCLMVLGGVAGVMLSGILVVILKLLVVQS